MMRSLPSMQAKKLIKITLKQIIKKKLKNFNK